MGQGDAYFVDVEVPEAVLLDTTPAPPRSRSPVQCGAVWYRGGHTTSVITEWTPEEGLGVVAYPVKPNATGAKRHPEGSIAFTAATNTGLVAEGALSETRQFTCAVRFDSPKGEARTLVTINPSDADNYLFLNEKEGELTWQDQKGSVAVAIPSPPTPAWVVVGYEAGRLSIAAASEDRPLGAPVASTGNNPRLDTDLSGSSDLFIGCRSHRKGILKTLGTSRIMDVLLWSDSFVLTPGAAAELNAVCRHAETEGAPE
ncbi:hypothetical protein GCM10016455_25650 [Aliiroseovarius zhejiangensis]|uniref:LamG domain-containing protein n=1 Tax=Aliiroseovarius zhejiangensis TaxID=1632025 RepID=A0ABQ3J7S8_9RHOB|nr:hypothetical protein [Aliiroseovarius zhejiangensis]GHF03273.1 hypothetical protein GCM10016455_25650 [Aliiroseovarius zhejiangensis]